MQDGDSVVIEFPINDDANNFIRWLKTQMHGLAEPVTAFIRDGRIDRIVLREPRIAHRYMTQIVVEIPVVAFMDDKIVQDLRSDGISFVIDAPNDKEAKIAAACNLPDFQSFFVNLLRDIAGLYPESKRFILRQLISASVNEEMIQSLLADHQAETIITGGKKQAKVNMSSEPGYPEIIATLKKEQGWGYELPKKRRFIIPMSANRVVDRIYEFCESPGPGKIDEKGYGVRLTPLPKPNLPNNIMEPVSFYLAGFDVKMVPDMSVTEVLLKRKQRLGDAYARNLLDLLKSFQANPTTAIPQKTNQPFPSDGLRAALENGYYDGSFSPPKSLVKDFRYPGKLQHFKAFMKRLIDSELTSWEAKNGVWLECQDTFPPDPNVLIERWHIRTQMTSNPDAWATMVAYGEKANETQICFFDGFNAISEPHERPRLGPVLLELADFIEKQACTGQETNEPDETTGGGGRKIILQSKPPGRPRDPLYDEAFERMCQGQDEKEVFVWYCEERGWSNPGKSEKDAFKAAIKRRRKGS